MLIALSAEQLVTVFHDQSTSLDARKSVRAEIGANLHLLMGRVEAQVCIDHRLDEIGQLLAQARRTPTAPKLDQPLNIFGFGIKQLASGHRV